MNFAGRLVRRLGPNSQLIDAATGKTISATEIRGLIVGAAAGFLSAGLRTGDPVLVSCGLSPASTLAYLGAMYAGLVPLLLEDRALDTSGESLCSKTRAKAVWTGNAMQCAWAKRAGVIHLAGRFDTRSDRLLDPAPRAETDLASLMPTSGSTGVPRLARVTHSNLIANTEAIIRSQFLGANERAMLILPLSYCFGASVVHTHLYQGGGVVFDSRFMSRVVVFGPRLSVAAMDAAVWNQPAERSSWCQRIARDVWQFDQQACSSPQVLFLERGAGGDVSQFVEELRQAFHAENRMHPRRAIHPALTSAICLARATWLLDNVANKAWFSQSPDWTILLGEGSDIPKPTQGRTLSVLVMDDLLEAISKFDGAVQTLGLAIGNAEKEDALAQAAGWRGVDRIVKLGRMHVFGSPWDGVDLIRPMVRIVRHVPSQD